MNDSTEQPPRSRWDFIHFGVIFFGFILGAGSVIINSFAGAMLGIILIAIGLAYFAIRRSDLD